jgi:hypothetical protein
LTLGLEAGTTGNRRGRRGKKPFAELYLEDWDYLVGTLGVSQGSHLVDGYVQAHASCQRQTDQPCASASRPRTGDRMKYKRERPQT